MNWLKTYALYFAWVISLIGLLASLYFGEMLHYEPCRLCWYQRIFFFPLAFILGIAAYRQDRQIVIYTLPLVALGALFALYQVLEGFIPALSAPALCGRKSDCSAHILTLFGGWVTLPMLSLLGFVVVGGLLVWAGRAYNGYKG